MIDTERALQEALEHLVRDFELKSCDGKQRRADYSACDLCDGEGEDGRPETIEHAKSCVVGEARAALARAAGELPSANSQCPYCSNAEPHHHDRCPSCDAPAVKITVTEGRCACLKSEDGTSIHGLVSYNYCKERGWEYGICWSCFKKMPSEKWVHLRPTIPAPAARPEKEKP